MGIKDIISHLKGKEQGQQVDSQKVYKASITSLRHTAETLRQSGNVSFTDFSYGPEGPSQQMWETSIINDMGVFNKSDIDNNGRKYQIYEMLFNNGEYAQVRVEAGEIVNLVVKDRENVFREVTLSNLPLKGCKLTASDIMEAMDYLQINSQTSNNSQNEETLEK